MHRVQRRCQEQGEVSEILEIPSFSLNPGTGSSVAGRELCPTSSSAIQYSPKTCRGLRPKNTSVSFVHLLLSPWPLPLGDPREASSANTPWEGRKEGRNYRKYQPLGLDREGGCQGRQESRSEKHHTTTIDYMRLASEYFSKLVGSYSALT